MLPQQRQRSFIFSTHRLNNVVQAIWRWRCCNSAKLIFRIRFLHVFAIEFRPRLLMHSEILAATVVLRTIDLVDHMASRIENCFIILLRCSWSNSYQRRAIHFSILTEWILISILRVISRCRIFAKKPFGIAWPIVALISQQLVAVFSTKTPIASSPIYTASTN